MGLKGTQEELYKRETTIEGDRHRSNPYNIHSQDSAEKNKESPESILEKERHLLEEQEKEKAREEIIKKRKKKGILVGILALSFIGFISVVAVIFGLVREWSFDEDRVQIAIDGIDAVGSGENVHFAIHIDNKNRSVLEDVSLVVQYPAGFRPQKDIFSVQEGSQKGQIQIGEIKAKENIPLDISGSFFGSADEVMYMDFFLRYSTTTGDGRFEKKMQHPVTLTNSSVALDLNGTLEATPGEQVEYIIEYSNNTINPIYNARIVATLSDRFSLLNTEPQVSETELTRSLWYLGSIDPGESGAIRIRGAYYQPANSKGSIKVELGYLQGDNTFYALASQDAITAVKPSLMAIEFTSLEEENIARVEQDFPFELTYKNEGEIGLPSAIAQVIFDGDIWDYDAFRLPRGNWNDETKTITWRASDIPELSDLSPGETGKITFSLPVLPRIEVSGKKDRNFSSNVRAIIDSPDALSRLGLENVAGRDAVSFKLQTFVDVDIAVEEKVSQTPLGEISFKEGEEVILDVNISLQNPYNDVTNTQLELSIPSEVSWEGFLDEIDKETVSFDERRRSIIWDLGEVKAGTGVYESARNIGFEIRFTPQAYQENTSAVILTGINFSGKDMFIDKDISFSIEDLKTRNLRW